jgi:hypothetical protein
MPPSPDHVAHASQIAGAVGAGTLWPTIERVLAAVAAAAGSLASVVGVFNRRKLAEVHVLVNGNLAAAVDQVKHTAGQLAAAEADRDQVRAHLAKIGRRAEDKHAPAGALPSWTYTILQDTPRPAATQPQEDAQ